MTNLWKLSARDLAQGIREKDFSATEVAESVLGRVAVKNPDLNAITVEFPEQALAAAADADAALAHGDTTGPLHGVPVTIKENTDVANQATPNGVPAFADLIASEDAPLVRNLGDAGAIIIGRTNVPEFSMRGTTVNPLRGRTLTLGTKTLALVDPLVEVALLRLQGSALYTTETTSADPFAFPRSQTGSQQ